MSEAPHPRQPGDGAMGDDIVLPFRTERSGIRGRIVRLGASVDTILSRHGYPVPVSEALGHALALTALLGSTLKMDGKLSLQTRTEGAIRLVLADFETPGKLRGYASFDEEAVAALPGEPTLGREAALLGKGHLALTLDPGGGQDRSQGIVALDGTSIAGAALTYFRQSEQLPTYLRLAVARHYVAGADGGQGRWTWRAGGLLIQHLDPASSDDAGAPEDELHGDGDEDWQRVRILAATVEDHELVDPMLSPERLLLRLFHEEGVRTFEARPMAQHCRCSRERVKGFLERFGAEELTDMREPDGSLVVTCEFCNEKYRFEPGAL